MIQQEKLITKINNAANIISNNTRSHQSYYIIISPKIADILENLDIRKHRRKKLKAIFKSQENKKTSE